MNITGEFANESNDITFKSYLILFYLVWHQLLSLGGTLTAFVFYGFYKLQRNLITFDSMKKIFKCFGVVKNANLPLTNIVYIFVLLEF